MIDKKSMIINMWYQLSLPIPSVSKNLFLLDVRWTWKQSAACFWDQSESDFDYVTWYRSPEILPHVRNLKEYRSREKSFKGGHLGRENEEEQNQIAGKAKKKGEN